MNYQEAQEKWQAMKKTKYPDSKIRELIESTYIRNSEYVPANAQTAMAMIAYNEMIDRRIERAQKSWEVR